MLLPESIKAISEHAEAEYPRECCGIVTGRGEVQRVHKCRNLQDELHTRDPEAHPRTSREAYAMDRDEAERIMKDATARGESVIAFYHSHIECGAYFSHMDKDVLTVFGEPEFPEAAHVVAAVFEGRVREFKGYLWDAENQDFASVAVQ